MNTHEAIEILERDLGDMPDCDSKEALTHAIESMKRGAPEGWQMVPKEPTDEILGAMHEQCDGYNSLYYKDLYKAVLEAAQI